MKALRTQREREEARERSQKANALFTDAEVRQIRKALAGGGVSYLEIAQAHGCGVQTIKKLKRGDTYGWVLEEGAENLEAREESRYSREGAAPEPLEIANSLKILQERLQEKAGKPDLEGMSAAGNRLAAELLGKRENARTPLEIAEEAQNWADAQDRQVVAGLPPAGA